MKKLFMLFKIGRKLVTTGAISSIYKIYNPPIAIKILFFIIGFSLNRKENDNSSPGNNLCIALQEMGTTFIKLGQFLATRPDIIGDNIAKDLEKLQDKLPPFDLTEAKNILREELGNENFNKILNISDPIAAASIAQVHLAKIKENHNQLPILLNNTKNVIEYANNFEKSKNLKTKRKFWELIDD